MQNHMKNNDSEENIFENGVITVKDLLLKKKLVSEKF